MKKRADNFTLKHIIAQISREDRELHMKQAYSAILKMIEKERGKSTISYDNSEIRYKNMNSR